MVATSKNQQDNERHKFKDDKNGDVAVNICGEQLNDIVTAVNNLDPAVASGKTSPTIYNVNITSANTEFSQALSADTKGFTMRVRGNAELQFSFTTGTTNTNYMTLKRGAVYSEEGMNATGLTIYFESSSSGITVEIVEWT